MKQIGVARPDRHGTGTRFTALLAAALLVTAALPTRAQDDRPDAALLARGAMLYARHCATCHGDTGRGDGPASYLLNPKPRNFVSGTFRIISTDNGNPSDDDLLGTLRRGMPGSAMPPWAHLPEADLRALATTVRSLMIEGRIANALADDADLSREEALADVLEDYSPGAPATIAPPPPEADIDLAKGAANYTKNCAACHGADGRGNVPVEKFDSEGWPIGARDFTAGIFKGGSRPEDIARSISLGFPGSPMPASVLNQDELWSLVHYVQKFIDPAAQQNVLQSRHVLTAWRLRAGADAELTTDPDAACWTQVEPTWLALMPLWWRNVRPEGVFVQALHDGRHLALRLTWRDETRDDIVLDQDAFTDAAAVQVSAEADPPFFGMGDADGPVHIWQWKASWQRDIAIAPDGDWFPNAPTGELVTGGVQQGELFQTATAAGNPIAQRTHRCPIEDANAQGQGTLTSQPEAAQNGDGAGRWRASPGEWAVVFLRDLGAPAELDVVPQPGGSISVAFALWDGAAGDRNGAKSVSIWHELHLED